MAFPVKDVRYTVRRSGSHARRVYPRLLRDRSVMPSIDIAIQHFESMLSHERREFDPGVLAHFFADHKLARCIVACLGRSYRFRSRSIDELVTRSAARHLARRGLGDPRTLRLYLYDQVNAEGPGYLPSAERPAHYTSLETKLGLRRDELERLLYLDSPEHAVLERVAPMPTASDIVAQYNVRAIESLVRQAREVVLELTDVEARESLLESFREQYVEAELAKLGRSYRVIARGRQDGLGSWTRHGRRLSRAVLRLLAGAGRRVTSATIVLDLRGHETTLVMGDDMLAMLAAPVVHALYTEEASSTPSGGLSPGAIRLAQRAGVGVLRSPEPQIWSAGILLPDFAIRQGNQVVFVVAIPSRFGASRLCPLASHPLASAQTLFVGEPDDIAVLAEVGGRTASSSLSDRRWSEVAVQAALDFRIGEVVGRAA
jgi:predicted nuclease of restriction endonuclease-like RecB superfamily